jgi:hypothetical protein
MIFVMHEPRSDVWRNHYTIVDKRRTEEDIKQEQRRHADRIGMSGYMVYKGKLYDEKTWKKLYGEVRLGLDKDRNSIWVKADTTEKSPNRLLTNPAHPPGAQHRSRLSN